jgi:transposase
MAIQPSEEQWLLVVQIFRACRARRGARGRHDRKFLEALHHLGVYKLSWRELPARFGNWNSVWKRYWRWRRLGAFDSFLAVLAQQSQTADLVEIFKVPGACGHLGGKDEPALNQQGLDRAVGPPFLRSSP